MYGAWGRAGVSRDAPTSRRNRRAAAMDGIVRIVERAPIAAVHVAAVIITAATIRPICLDMDVFITCSDSSSEPDGRTRQLHLTREEPWQPA